MTITAFDPNPVIQTKFVIRRTAKMAMLDQRRMTASDDDFVRIFDKREVRNRRRRGRISS